MRMAVNVRINTPTPPYVPAADNFLAYLNWTNGSVSPQVTLRSSLEDTPFASFPGNDEDQLLNLTILPNNFASLSFPVVWTEANHTATVLAVTGTLLDPNAHRQNVRCMNPISGQYGQLPRILFYCLLVFALVFRRHEWLSLAALGTAMSYAAVSAVHIIILTVRKQFTDPDVFGIFPLLSTSGIMLTPILMWSTTVRKNRAQAVIIYWGILVYAGLLCATYGLLAGVELEELVPIRSIIVCTPTPACSTVPWQVTAMDFDRCNCIDFCGLLGIDAPMRRSGNMVALLFTEATLAASASGFFSLYVTNQVALAFIFVNGIIGILGSRYRQEQIRHAVFRFFNADRRKIVSKFFGGQRRDNILAKLGLQNPDASPTKWTRRRYFFAKGIAAAFYLTAVSLTIFCPVVFVINIVVNEIVVGMFPVGERADAIGAWGAWAGAFLVVFATVVDKYSKSWMDSILLALEGAWRMVKYSKADRAGRKPTISKRVDQRDGAQRIKDFLGVVASPFLHSWYSTRRGLWTVKTHAKFFVSWWREPENISKRTKAEIDRAWEDEELRIVGGMPICRCHICTNGSKGKNPELYHHYDMPGIQSRKPPNRWDCGSEDDIALARTVSSRPLRESTSSTRPLVSTPGPVDMGETSSLLENDSSSADIAGGGGSVSLDRGRPPPIDGGQTSSKVRDQLASKYESHSPATTQAGPLTQNATQPSTAGDHHPAIATQNIDYSPS